MIQIKTVRCIGWSMMLAVWAACLPTVGLADEKDSSTKRLKEPVYRVVKASATKNGEPAHVLDPAIKLAADGLNRIRKDIRDFTGYMVKRERIKGKLMPQEYMFVKVRHQQVNNGRVTVPFSVYLKYHAPKKTKGREVIFVEGRDNNKILVHEPGGIVGLKTLYLDPNGFLAMQGNRYPITEIGVEVLTKRLLEKGNRDRARGECKVHFYKNAAINGRRCTLLRVIHPVKRPYFDFHIAEIFIDDELQIPIRYAAYTWPQQRGGKPVLEEEYTYMNIKLNVGLNDLDFDIKNPAYDYP